MTLGPPLGARIGKTLAQPLRAMLLSCLLALCVLRAAADDPGSPPPAPPTPEQQSDAVLAAIQAKDDGALKALAVADEPDPWLVADWLVARGEPVAAAAFAKAAPRKDVEALPAYIASRTGKTDDAGARSTLGKANEAWGRRDGEATLALVRDVRPDLSTLIGIRIAATLGRALSVLGHHRDGAAGIRVAAEAAERLGWRSRAAWAFQESGQAAGDGSDWIAALAAYESWRKQEEARGNRVGIAWAHGLTGSTLYSLGAYSEAEAHQLKALDMERGLANRAGEARALGNLANLNDARGDTAKALEMYESARKIFEGLGDRGGEAAVLANVGLVYDELGDLAKALALFLKALEIAEEISDARGAAITLGNIGRAHAALGDPEQALKDYARAFEANDGMGNRAEAAVNLVNIGILHAAQRDFAKALESYERARKILEEVGDRPGAAAALIDIGEAQFESGDKAKALETHQKALAEAEGLGGANLVIMAHSNVARDWLRLGEYAKAVAEAKLAVNSLARVGSGLADAESAGGRERYLAAFDVGAAAAAALRSPAEMAYFLESGRAGALLASLCGRDALRAAVVPESLRREEAAARSGEAIATTAYRAAREGGNRKETQTRRAEADAASARVLDVIAKIQRAAKAGAALIYPEAAGLDALRASLRDGEALVLYALLSEDAYALVIEPKDARIVELGKTARVAEAVAALDLGAVSVDPTAALAALSGAVAGPLRLDAKIRRVLVSPAGALSYVPFAAVLPGRDVVYVPSGTTYGVLASERALRGEKILALGDPDYQTTIDATALALMRSGASNRAGESQRSAAGGLVRLPATADEAKAIGDVVLLGRDASEKGFRDAVAKRPRWHAVHLACHGLLDAESPMLSCLALAAGGEDDGFLRAIDLFRMKVPADLVVLSACETGKGKIFRAEGIVGLTRAFMYAGAPRVLCSLWKVDDEATRALMTKFYSLWNPKDGSKPMEAAAALRAAQEHVKSQEKWRHPYYWAAWVLWGLGD